MEAYIPFTDEKFLNNLKTDFFIDLLKIYKDLGPIENVKSSIVDKFKLPNIKESDIKFNFESLLLGSDTDEDLTLTSENVKRIHRSLSVLTPSQAAMEKIWVALLNSHYIDYHLHVIRQLQGEQDVDQKIWDRTFMTGRNGDKRHQLMNNLSLLWWIAYHTYDKDNSDNPYHLTEFFVSVPYRGTAIVFFSSNIHSNQNITLGILDGVKYLVDNNVIAVNRYAFSNASKIINIVAGVKLVDLMTREDIRQIIIEELPKTDGINLVRLNTKS